MSHPAAERWNARYAEEGAKWMGKAPSELLRQHAQLLPATGLALDAAAGVGANGLFLAECGLRVMALDISEVALRLAVQRARARALPLMAAVYDLAQPWFPANHFAVILNFRFLERLALPVYRRSLRPGGLLFFETFLNAGTHPAGPPYYLHPGELRQAFRGFEIVHWAERNTSAGDRVLEQLVARKPAAGA